MGVAVDRRWAFTLDGAPDVVWATITDTASFPSWWPWLRCERLPAVAVGAEAVVAISPPLPYELDVRIVVTDVVPGRLVAATVDGDLVGDASVEVVGRPDGTTTVVLDLALTADGAGVDRVPRAAAPLLRLGHTLVMERGVRQFAAATGLHVADREVRRAATVRVAAVGGIVVAAAVAGAIAVGRRRCCR